MKILVTGTEGYIGSLLAPILMQHGHEVIGVDTGFYKVGWLYNGTELTALTLNKDIRHITAVDLQGVEAVVHLAELSNDPDGFTNSWKDAGRTQRRLEDRCGNKVPLRSTESAAVPRSLLAPIE